MPRRTRRKAAQASKDRFAHPKYVLAQVSEALKESMGFVSIAAKRLGCERQTIYTWMEKHKELKQIREDAEDMSLDEAEVVLKTMIRAQNFPAVRFYLITKGRKRGYIERVEHTGAEGGPIEVADRSATIAWFAAQLTRRADARAANGADRADEHGQVGRA
jgi:hypothetical protein